MDVILLPHWQEATQSTPHVALIIQHALSTTKGSTCIIIIDLAREVGRMWGVRAKVVPVVIGALGTVPLRLKVSLKALGVDISISLIQKSALLGSARILRRVLEMKS